MVAEICWYSLMLISDWSVVSITCTCHTVS